MKKHTKSLVGLIDSVVGRDEMTGCEVGVWKGENSHKLLTRYLLLRLYMVDQWNIYSTIRGVAKKSQEKMTRVMAGAVARTNFAADRRVVIIDRSWSAATMFPIESLDFVFIDADHSGKAVRKDLAAWYPKVKSGGLVSGHDYGIWLSKHRGFGVTKAVDEFCKASGYKVGVAKGSVWWFQKK